MRPLPMVYWTLPYKDLSPVQGSSPPPPTSLLMLTSSVNTVADPGFTRGGSLTPKVDIKLLFGYSFPKNCMKLKEYGL